MPLYSGYDEWIAGLKDWLDVDDYTDAQILVFMKLGTRMMNTDLRAYHMEKSADYTVLAADVTNGYITVSDIASDFNGVRQITVDGYDTEVISINEYRKMVSTTAPYDTGFYYYCIDAGRLLFYPAVSAGSEVVLDYWEMVPDLADTTQETNTFTVYYDHIFLMAASLAAAPYLVDDERIATWQSQYEALVTRENGDLNRQKMGSTPLRRNITSLS